jgi:diacylglycerol kinase
MSNDPNATKRSWGRKFRDAFRGARVGVRGQGSFLVHFLAAALVVAVAAGLRVRPIEWCILLLCIAGVLIAEMLNSALEWMAKAVQDEDDPRLRNALDIGSGAVLVASIGAAVVGTIVFVNRVAAILGWIP